MRRREVIAGITAATIFYPGQGLAQQPKLPVVGVLVIGNPQQARVLRRLREEMGKLGYVEGRNIHFEVRSAQGDSRRLPGLAAELARQQVDVLATWMTPTVLAAKAATSEIPIVMLGVADPVGSGLVASLAHPGGNITGFAGVIPELAGKLVELLTEALPHHARFAALCNTADPFRSLF
jgi:ABC-type uncharacterized transport system substrate-binding protein